MLRTACLSVLLVVALLAGISGATTARPSVSVTLNPSVPSPELLGTSITWTATVSGGQQGHTYDYQFSAR